MARCLPSLCDINYHKSTLPGVYHLCVTLIITNHHGQVFTISVWKDTCGLRKKPVICANAVYACKKSFVHQWKLKQNKKKQNKKSSSSPLICVWGSRWRHCWIHWPWSTGGTGESPSVQSRLDQIDNAIIHRVPLWYLDIKAISCLAAPTIT